MRIYSRIPGEDAGAPGSANTGAKDLLSHIQDLIGSENKMLDKAARWAAEGLGGAMPSNNTMEERAE